MITTRPATIEDVRRFYPEHSCSFRAWVAEMDGVPEGIIGLALSRPLACMFSTFNEALRPHLKCVTVLRIIKQAERAVKESRVPVIALAESDEPTAPGILTRLGFKSAGVTGDGEVFVWGLT